MSYKDFLTTKWFVGTEEEEFDDEENENEEDEMDDYDDGITPESYQSVVLDSGVEFSYEDGDDGLVELNEKSSLLNKVQSLAHRTATLDIRIYMLGAVIIMMIMGGMSYNNRRTSVARVKKGVVAGNPQVILPFVTTDVPTDAPTTSPTIFSGATSKPIANIKPKPSASQSTVAPSQTASPSTAVPTPKATMKPQLLPGQTFAPTPIPTVPPTPAVPSESPTTAPTDSSPPSLTPTGKPSPMPSPQPSEKPNYATMYPSTKPHTGMYHTQHTPCLCHTPLVFVTHPLSLSHNPCLCHTTLSYHSPFPSTTTLL